MKKVLIAIAIIFGLIISTLLVLPLFFKDDIVRWVKADINKNVAATVDFQRVDLSFFRNFPKLTITLQELTIINHAPFDGDTLASVPAFMATADLWSLFGGGPLAVSGILIDQPRLHLKVQQDGRENWQILLQTPEKPANSIQQSNRLNLVLQQYEIQNAQIRYDNAATNENLQLEGLSHRGKGNFSRESFTLFTETQVGDIYYQNGGATYLKDAKLNAKIDMEVDLAENKYILKENIIQLNALNLHVDGWFASNENGLRMDLRFDAPEARFKDLLSMIPFIYKKDFAGLQADGRFSLTGVANGLLDEKTVPSFNIELQVQNGMFHYPGQPTPVKNVQIKLRASNPGKTADHSLVNLEKFYLEILNDPIEGKILIKTPVSDPYLETSVKGKLNLGELQKIFPLKAGMELKGELLSDFQLKGKLSEIQKNQVDKFSTGGTLAFKDVFYSSPDLAEKITIKSALLQFSPQKATLSNFQSIFGKSNLAANGVLENIFGYIFHHQTIKGTLAVQSSHLDLNPWLAGEAQPLTPVVLPERIEFLLSADFNNLQFDNLNLINVKSTILLKNQVLNLMDFSAGILKGTLTTNGTYSYIPPAKPNIYFDLNVSGFSIAEAFQKFVTVQKFAPLSQKMDGIFSGHLNLTSDLDDAFMPVWQQLFSRGDLNIPKVKITDTEVFNKISEKLKIEALHNPSLSNLSPRYSIKNGRFYLDPINFTCDKYKIAASGSNGIDQSLDYKLKVDIPAAEFKQKTNTLVTQFIKQDINLLTNETVTVDVMVGGTIKNPQINISGAEVIKGITDPAKAAALAEAEKKKAELNRIANEKLEKQKAELEKKKKEAEQKLKDKLKNIFKK